MKTMRWSALGLATVVVMCGCHSGRADIQVGTSPAGKPMVAFSDKNSDYQNAVAEARRTMPEFLKRLANPQPHEFFYVDAGLRNSKGDHEWIWIRNVTYAHGSFTGQLTDEPADVPGKHKDDTVTADEKDVDDWSIQHDNSSKSEGGFTIAVLDKMRGVNSSG